jgi:hypothetical protein
VAALITSTEAVVVTSITCRAERVTSALGRARTAVVAVLMVV